MGIVIPQNSITVTEAKLGLRRCPERPTIWPGPTVIRFDDQMLDEDRLERPSKSATRPEGKHDSLGSSGLEATHATIRKTVQRSWARCNNAI